MLQAIVALDIWNELAVLRHAPWLGRLLAASIPRQTGATTAAHSVMDRFRLRAKNRNFESRGQRYRRHFRNNILALQTTIGKTGKTESCPIAHNPYCCCNPARAISHSA